MTVDRRTALKGMVTAGAAVLVGGGEISARERGPSPDDAVGMLYDATLCIGCKTCVVACKEANDLPPDTETLTPQGLYDAPLSLNSTTKNIIQLYKGGDKLSYVKKQCMHCYDPACASACMIGALHKMKDGVVAYDLDRCIGCRYCQVACPFEVPKFQWDKAAPRIVKCEMCRHLLAKGGIPACCKVCPREAVIFGKRNDLLLEAKARLKKDPDKYNPKIYGEKDAGGTHVIYLAKAGFSFENLGFPDLGDEGIPELSETIQHGIYKGFIAPVVLYAILGGVVWRNRKRGAQDHDEEVKP